MTPPAIVAPAHLGVDLNRLLDAIAAVESRGDPTAKGRHGERGAHQMLESTWRECTSLPWSYALDPAWESDVARFYLIKLKYQLQERRIEPTPYNLALAWNQGAKAVILAKWLPREVKDRATRISTLYNAR